MDEWLTGDWWPHRSTCTIVPMVIILEAVTVRQKSCISVAPSRHQRVGWLWVLPPGGYCLNGCMVGENGSLVATLRSDPLLFGTEDVLAIAFFKSLQNTGTSSGSSNN